MKLDVNTGSIITQEEAKALIGAFKTKFPGEVTSSFIGANNVKNILDQENCIGLKIHNGYNVEDERICLILLGLDAEGKEILEKGIIYERIITSPPFGFIESL